MESEQQGTDRRRGSGWTRQVSKKSKFLICKLPKTRGQMNKSFESLEFDSPREDLPELAKNGEEEQFFLQLWITVDVDQVD